MDTEPAPRTLRGRPGVPLTVPLVFALAVWGVAVWDRAYRPLQPAGPPQFEVDWVALELRRFHALTDPGERVRALTRLGPIRDPRVTLALVGVVQTELGKARTGATETPGVLLAASSALFEHHIPESGRVYGVKYWRGVEMWWATHEAEVRGRAALLPQ